MIKKLTDDCRINFTEIFSEERIGASDINALLRQHTRIELNRAHAKARERLDEGYYSGKECAKQLSDLHDNCLLYTSPSPRDS